MLTGWLAQDNPVYEFVPAAIQAERMVVGGGGLIYLAWIRFSKSTPVIHSHTTIRGYTTTRA